MICGYNCSLNLVGFELKSSSFRNLFYVKYLITFWFSFLFPFWIWKWWLFLVSSWICFTTPQKSWMNCVAIYVTESFMYNRELGSVSDKPFLFGLVPSNLLWWSWSDELFWSLLVTSRQIYTVVWDWASEFFCFAAKWGDGYLIVSDSVKATKSAAILYFGTHRDADKGIERHNAWFDIVKFTIHWSVARHAIIWFRMKLNVLISSLWTSSIGAGAPLIALIWIFHIEDDNQ